VLLLLLLLLMRLFHPLLHLHAKDTKWKSIPPPSASQLRDQDAESMDFIFVRHGESTWNTTFNRSKLPWKFIPRLLDAAFKELMLIITGQQDSWFIDSPLSDLGLEQAEEFKKFLADNQSNSEVKLILGDSESKSTMVSSNLRRAISTGVVGASARIEGKEEKIILHSALQEISRNPDTMAVTPANSVPVASWMDAGHTATNVAKIYKTYLDPECHTGHAFSFLFFCCVSCAFVLVGTFALEMVALSRTSAGPP
jgi:hypothetical protein